MLIAVASEGTELNSMVAEKFGRTPFIIFYDTEKKAFESLRNPYADSFGGAGIQTAQFIIGKNASVVISRDVGLNPLRFFSSAEIQVYSCPRYRILQAVNDFLEGKLNEADREGLGRIRFRGKGRNRNRKKK